MAEIHDQRRLVVAPVERFDADRVADKRAAAIGGNNQRRRKAAAVGEVRGYVATGEVERLDGCASPLDGSSQDRGVERREEGEVGDVVAEGVEPDLRGMEEDLRRADEAPRGVDDA